MQNGSIENQDNINASFSRTAESVENPDNGNASLSGTVNIQNESTELQNINSSIGANGAEAELSKLCVLQPDNFRQCPNEDCDLRPPDFKVFGELLNRGNDDPIGEGSNCIKHPDYCECAPNECCSFCGNPIEKDNKKGGVAEDPRLKAWQHELLVRRRIAKRIMKRTGKMACEILFNRRSVDDRDKIVLQRFLDQADRLPKMNHSVTKELVTHSPGGKCEKYYDMPMKHMLVLPSNGEVIPLTAVEISGVPARVRQEMYGTDCSCMPGRRWIDSKELKRSISQRRDSLKRLVEFFPDLDNLIVIGKAMTIIQGGTPDPDEVCNCNVQLVDPPVNIYADVNIMKENTMDECTFTATGCAIPSTTKLAGENDALANNQQNSESKDDALGDNQQISDETEATLAMQSEIKNDALPNNQQILDGNEENEHISEESQVEHRNQNKSKHIPSISVDVTVVTNMTDTDGEADENDPKNNNVHTTVYRQSFATHDDPVVASKAVTNGNEIRDVLPDHDESRLLEEKHMSPSQTSPKQTSPKLLSPILSAANKNSSAKTLGPANNDVPTNGSSRSDESQNSRSVKKKHRPIKNTDTDSNDENQDSSPTKKNRSQKPKDSGTSMVW